VNYSELTEIRTVESKAQKHANTTTEQNGYK